MIAPVIAADAGLVIAAARAWIGTPYHDQASLRGVGCDCLGLARGVWREVVGPEPAELPPYSRDWAETGLKEPFADALRPLAIEVDPAAAGPGALLIFRMRGRGVAKHCGILDEGGRFIHAWERGGVVSMLLDHGWARRVAYAFLYPAPCSVPAPYLVPEGC